MTNIITFLENKDENSMTNIITFLEWDMTIRITV